MLLYARAKKEEGEWYIIEIYPTFVHADEALLEGETILEAEANFKEFDY